MTGFAGRRLHMVGIGGAGMSALAAIAYAWGADVDGCDTAPSGYTQRLERFGIPVASGHDRSHLADGVDVVVSSAVSADTDEVLEARGRRLTVLHRAELLAEMVAAKRSICVAGAHGKTTTTAMLAYAATRLGLDPTWLVGGDVPQLGGNAGPGGGELLVAEADESDGSCSLLRPHVALVTNIELDHHARFGSDDELRALFAAWVASVPGDGVVLLGDGVDLDAAAPRAWFGFDERADWRVTAFEANGAGSRFWLRVPSAPPVRVELRLPGRHNAQNAAGAVAALVAVGASPADAAAALRDFDGAGRRFERRGSVAGAEIVDDYAHHPTEVAAAIEAARAQSPARVVVCFQPHLYSRTEALARRFGEALAAADEAVVTEIYAAREQPVPGVTAKLVVDALAERRPGMPLAYEPTLEDAADYLRARVRAGDMVLTVGAGDVRRVGDLLLG
ncbi:MAG TPA: UDP-N-acetylmuramate--L-alanine ligase [Gaiellales bacterium]|nr:UDP-N-acetylmuramate--L-alanine ligase [Gaiellales bacterium]